MINAMKLANTVTHPFEVKVAFRTPTWPENLFDICRSRAGELAEQNGWQIRGMRNLKRKEATLTAARRFQSAVEAKTATADLALLVSGLGYHVQRYYMLHVLHDTLHNPADPFGIK